MARYENHQFEPAKFLTVATNVLHQYLLDIPRDQAKGRFNQMVEKGPVPLVRLKLDDNSEMDFYVELDSREYNGKLNFSAFRDQVALMVHNFGQHLTEKRAVTILNDQSGRRLMFQIPILSSEDGQELNALMLGVDLMVPGKAVLQLMFVDSAQFRKQAS